VSLASIVLGAFACTILASDEPDHPSAKADLARVLRERLETLQEAAGLQRRSYERGESSLEAVIAVDLEVLQARLELAGSAAERVQIRREMLETARGLEKAANELFKAAQATRLDVLRAKASRLRAEADLLRERVDTR
jgi:outer membrane protein TolC